MFAMVLPLVFTALFYYFNDARPGDDWDAYTNSLNLFYGVFLSALIPSFVSIFSLYYEFKEGTIKTVLFSAYDRSLLIIAKLAFVCLYIIILYASAAFLTVLSGIPLGFDRSAASLARAFLHILLPGITSILFVPMMAYLTLLFKSFIPPLIIAFIGTIGSVALINIGNAFYYPWLVSTNLFFRMREMDQMSVLPPVILFLAYFLIFGIAVFYHFNRMDFDSRVS